MIEHFQKSAGGRQNNEERVMPKREIAETKTGILDSVVVPVVLVILMLAIAFAAANLVFLR